MNVESLVGHLESLPNVEGVSVRRFRSPARTQLTVHLDSGHERLLQLMESEVSEEQWAVLSDAIDMEASDFLWPEEEDFLSYVARSHAVLGWNGERLLLYCAFDGDGLPVLSPESGETIYEVQLSGELDESGVVLPELSEPDIRWFDGLRGSVSEDVDADLCQRFTCETLALDGLDFRAVSQDRISGVTLVRELADRGLCPNITLLEELGFQVPGFNGHILLLSEQETDANSYATMNLVTVRVLPRSHLLSVLTREFAHRRPLKKRSHLAV